MKIAVLCGGLSNERDVSISTGTGAARALRENGHLLEDHVGGCVLYEKRELVERLLKESKGSK